MTDADGAADAGAMETVAVQRALDELAALGTDRDREQIGALRDRLDGARLRVLVAGEAKRGKSTLINALLGRALLPAGVTPLTAVATTVRYGDDPHAQVRFADGHEEKQPLPALPDLVTERGNPRNQRHIAAVTVYADAPLLADGVELVDTPGTGSVFAWTPWRRTRPWRPWTPPFSCSPPTRRCQRPNGTCTPRSPACPWSRSPGAQQADHVDAAGLAEAAEFTGRVLAEVSASPAPGRRARRSGSIPCQARGT